MSLLVLVVIGFAGVTTLSLVELKSELMQAKIEKVEALNESATSIVKANFQRMEKGELTEAQAKQGALAILRGLRYENDNYFWVNDMSRVVVMHPVNPELEGKDASALTDPDGIPIFQRAVDLVRAEGAGVFHYRWARAGAVEPVAKISHVSGFTPWGWVIGTGIYVDDVEAAFAQALVKELSQISVVLLLLLSAMVLIKNSIVGPVREASQTMIGIAEENDLTRRLPEEGRDEISEMARSFNRYTDKMEEMVGRVSGSTLELTEASDALSVVASSTREGVERQQSETEQVATAVTEMSSTVREIARSAEEAAAAAQGADDNAEDGQRKVEAALAAIRTLSQRVEQSAGAVQKLNSESETIGSVLDVIRSIAEQTNLLALNAAIEAARAGEQGRGFAVVADEVRSLAGRTQESTAEIQQMIERLQSGSLQAVAEIEQSRETAEETVGHAEQAGNALREIVGAVGTIKDMNTQIASAAEEQAVVAQQIDHSVVAIAELADQSTGNVARTSDASGELADLGERLLGMVQQFKTRGQA
jgi:methyl-accepting chemotaxis protein